MLKLMSLLAIFAITISFGLQYADAQRLVVYAAPDPPTNLHGVVLDQAIRLTWSAPSGQETPIIAYIVSGTEINCYVDECSIIDPSRIPGTTHTITNLDNTKDYKFTVQSLSAGGTSILGSGDRASPTITIERKVQDVEISNITTTTATISWKEPSNSAITQYDVIVKDIENNTVEFRRNNVADNNPPDTDNTSGSISVNVTGLNPRNVHEFKVVAKQSGISPNLFVVVNERMLGAPEPPSNFKIKDQIQGSITLEWDEPTNPVTNYRMEVFNLTDNNFRNYYFLSGNATESQVTNLVDGKLYRFSLYAINDQGRGGTSSLVAQSISGLGGIKNLESESTNDTITLSWDKPNGKTNPTPVINNIDPNNGYSILVTNQGEFVKSYFVPDVVNPPDDPDYTWTAYDLKPNTTYTFVISVEDSDETKIYSDTTITVSTGSQNNPSSQSNEQRETQQSEQQSQQSEIPEAEYGGQQSEQQSQQSEIPEAEYGGQQSEQQSQQSEIPEAEYGGQPESKVSESESITLNVSAFSDSNGNGIQDEDESPLSNLMLLVYTPDTEILDIIYTKTDGTISKSDFTTNSFYVIAHPEDGYTSSTHPYPLDEPTGWGVLYVENPQIGSTYDMNVGITQDLQ